MAETAPAQRMKGKHGDGAFEACGGLSEALFAKQLISFADQHICCSLAHAQGVAPAITGRMSAAVGADVEALCSKCGDVWHVVVAKVGERIVKVQCKQCLSLIHI